MIPRIVLTGGPCGGKTTSLKYLKQHLPEMGITAVYVPEMATGMFEAGVRWPDVMHDEQAAFRFQVLMILGQIKNEEIHHHFLEALPSRQPKVLICDRGTVDNMVYAKDEWHKDILSRTGSLGSLKRRYDQIIHLDTLAYGAGYNTDNTARYETKDEAISTDKRTWEMWSKGPSIPHIRIMHTSSLNAKLNGVLDTVEQVARG